MANYRSAPVSSDKMPGGIPYIIGNEAAERFSFYGMKAILVIFMTQHLMGSDGELRVMSDEDATGYYHLFNTVVYATPFLGALLADVFLGKYRTIILLSTVYVLGHATLAVDDTRFGLALGLGLIALGAGGIKPCVSAHVGDQFGPKNEHLMTKVFSWFYFSINLGASISMLLTPFLLDRVGPGWAFGVPGVLMAIATIAFWMGRNKFVHIPPGGMKFLKEAFSRDAVSAILKLSVIFFFIAVFWALFDQTGSTWILQAQQMNLHLVIDWLPSQVQAVNGIFILILIPTFAYGVYPFFDRFFPLTPLRRICFGLFLTGIPFFMSAWLESRIIAGDQPSIAWQFIQYFILTSGEVMVSITGLEFFYTQAPKKMKSFVMAVFFLSVSAGNLFTAGVNFFIQNEDGTSKLEGAAYFNFFGILVTITAVLFIFVVVFYKEKRYIQDTHEAPEGPA